MGTFLMLFGTFLFIMLNTGGPVHWLAFAWLVYSVVALWVFLKVHIKPVTEKESDG